MSLVHRLLGSPLFVVANVSLVVYICQRLWRAMSHHHQVMLEMRDLQATVTKARQSLDYVGEEVARGMERIKEDIKQELSMTARMTKLSMQVGVIVQRFATLEEDVLEFVRKDRNAESVRLETPSDVTEEVRKALTRVDESRVPDWNDQDDSVHLHAGNTFPKLPVASASKEKQERPRSPVLPEVQLLREPKANASPRHEKRRE